MTKPRREGPKPKPWMPAHWDFEDAHAVKALQRGEASEDQQRRALRFIVDKVCATYDLSFHPGNADGARETDFAEGKRFVGLQLVKLINVDLSAIRQAKEGRLTREA